MKKTFTSFAALLLLSVSGISMSAQDFTVPAPQFTVPINGEAELLYNMFQVTWGYYGIVKNTGDDPITCTLTMPDGTEKTVKGNIDDANMEGTQEGKAPATEDNALSFRNFMQLDMETMQYIQVYGTYKVNIPEGVVLVNGVPNPEANMEFTIKGQEEASYMPEAEMVYPTSSYTSYAFAVQMYWPGQDIFFTQDVESMTLTADIDGKSLDCTASIQQVEGGNEDGSNMFTMSVLYISFDDFVSYMDGTYLTIYIPEGIVANDKDEINRAQDVEITLLPQLQGTLNPEDGAEIESDEACVTVSWEGLSVLPLMGSTVIARESSSRTDTPVNVTFSEEASISIDLSTLPDGQYEIVVPEAFLIILTEKGIIMDSYAINSEIYANYTIVDSESSGVENLKSENGVYDIYTIDGRPVAKAAEINVVKGLEPGIYIINGTKTLIRK